MPNQWDRQPDEPAKGWAAFQIYRDLGPFERSHARVLQQLQRPAGYLRTIESWSSRNTWVDRARAFDEHQDLLKQRRLARELEVMADRHAKTAKTMLELVDLKLQSVLRQVGAQVTASGGMSFDVPGLSLATLPILVKVAADLERISRGQATSSAEIRATEALMLPSALAPDDFALVVDRLRRSGRLPGQPPT